MKKLSLLLIAMMAILIMQAQQQNDMSEIQKPT